MEFGKRSGDKGFSLFTPLVGTAVVIIAILVAVVMIQNDIRMSRSLSNSYEASSQSLNAKLIRSAAEAKLISNARKTLYETLEEGIELECEDDCLSKIKSRVRARVSSSVNDDLEVYSGVTDSIAQVTEYSFHDPSTSAAINEKIEDALENMGNIFEFDYDSDGRIELTLNPDEFNGHEDAFTLGFKKGSNILKVNVAPTQELTVKTEEKILPMLEEAADTYDPESTDPYKQKDCDDWSYAEDAKLTEDDGSKYCKFHLETRDGEGKMKLIITHDWNEASPDSFDEVC